MRAKRLSLIAALAFAALGSHAFAQAITTPAAGSAYRTAIMDSMRTHSGDQNRVYLVKNLRVSGDWAWLDATPQSRDGRKIGRAHV